MNALAHVVSVLSTSSLAGRGSRAGAGAAAALVRGDGGPARSRRRDLGAREAAQRAASAAGGAFDRGKAGRAARARPPPRRRARPRPRGAPRVLLPQFVAHLRARDAALVDEIEVADRTARPRAAAARPPRPRAGVPTSLDGARRRSRPRSRRSSATRPELPASIVRGRAARPAPDRTRRPHRRSAPGRWRSSPGRTPNGRAASCSRCTAAAPRPGASSAAIREIAGHDRRDGDRRPAHREQPLVRRARQRAAARAPTPRSGARAGARRGRARRARPPRAHLLAGFSQGACLALEYAARHGGGPRRRCIAPAGVAHRHRRPNGRPARRASLPGCPSSSARPRTIRTSTARTLDATAAWFRAAGAAVEVIDSPGDRHDIRRASACARASSSAARGRRPDRPGSATRSRPRRSPARFPRGRTPRASPPHGLYAEQVNGTALHRRRAENPAHLALPRAPVVAAARVRAARPPALRRRVRGACRRGQPRRLRAAAAPRRRAPRFRRRDGHRWAAPAARRCAAATPSTATPPTATWSVARSTTPTAISSSLPELGALTALTELGPLDVAPGQIAVLPRGIAFSRASSTARSRAATSPRPSGAHFQLPERGPIGANGLADPRHFRAPPAWYEDKLAPDFRIVAKLGGRLHEASQDHSPFDVVAWHGNHVPFVYDLDDFSPAGRRPLRPPRSVGATRSLTAPLDEPGANALDLIVFPPRWDVTDGHVPAAVLPPQRDHRGERHRPRGRAPGQPVPARLLLHHAALHRRTA